MYKKRIVVIDPEEGSRLLAESILRLAPAYQFIASYDNLESALRNAERDKPEIIITDVDNDELGASQYIDRLIRKNYLVEILVMTGLDNDHLITECISHGAAGFVFKSNLIGNLIPAVEKLAAGGSPIDHRAARKLFDHLRLAQTTPLTPQESRILKLITEGKTYSRIARELDISTDTSKTHIKNIYRKLEVNSKTDAVRKAYRDRLVLIS